MVKNLSANAGVARDAGSFPVLGRSPGEGNGNPLQNSCLGNPKDRRSLVGYSPWGCKELDMTEYIHTHTFSYMFIYKSGLPSTKKYLNESV